MGCWGITAFESDAGLDAASVIRDNLPEDGKLELGKIIEAMRQDEWGVPDVTDGLSHTGPMALAEIIIKFKDQDISDLDYDGKWAANDNKFSSLTSFTASKESAQWLRDYLADTLKYAKENAEFRAKQGLHDWDQWGGWFKEEDWNGWQNHMSMLIDRMDSLLASPENQMELIPSQEQASGPVMGGQSI